MNDHVLNPKDSFRLVLVDISSDLIWHGHVVEAGIFVRSAQVFFSKQSATITEFKYDSHVWGTAVPTTLALLDSVQRRAGYLFVR